MVVSRRWLLGTVLRRPNASAESEKMFTEEELERKKKKEEKAREKKLKKQKASEKAKLSQAKATNAPKKSTKKSRKQSYDSEENPADFVDPDTPLGDKKRLSSKMATQFNPAAVEKSLLRLMHQSQAHRK